MKLTRSVFIRFAVPDTASSLIGWRKNDDCIKLLKFSSLNVTDHTYFSHILGDIEYEL